MKLKYFVGKYSLQKKTVKEDNKNKEVMRHREQKGADINPTISVINVNELNNSIKRLSDSIKKKKQGPILCCLQEVSTL